MKLVPESVAAVTGGHSYNDVLPLMLARYCGPGLLGLGVTALIAGFMSGMAGNVSAFTTVWTYDIYRPLMNPKASDHHYVNMGRWTTIIGVLISEEPHIWSCIPPVSWIMFSRCSASSSLPCSGQFYWECYGSGRRVRPVSGITLRNSLLSQHVGMG